MLNIATINAFHFQHHLTSYGFSNKRLHVNNKNQNDNRIREVVCFALFFTCRLESSLNYHLNFYAGSSPREINFSFLNRSSVKFSYSTMPNIGDIMAASTKNKLEMRLTRTS